MRTQTLAVVLILTGCATGYQQNSWLPGGGFSETQLSPTRVRVSFTGNTRTSIERAEDFTFLRCAELTIEKGYSHFLVIDDRQTVERSTSTTADPYGSTTIQKAEPTTTKTIEMLTSEAVHPEVYDANFLAASIRDKYNIP